MDKSILTVIADNPALLEELRKTFEAEFNDSELELGFSNERLGERVRARLEGLAAMKRVFAKISLYQTPPLKGEVKNQAR